MSGQVSKLTAIPRSSAERQAARAILVLLERSKIALQNKDVLGRHHRPIGVRCSVVGNILAPGSRVASGVVDGVHFRRLEGGPELGMGVLDLIGDGDVGARDVDDARIGNGRSGQEDKASELHLRRLGWARIGLFVYCSRTDFQGQCTARRCELVEVSTPVFIGIIPCVTESHERFQEPTHEVVITRKVCYPQAVTSTSRSRHHRLANIMRHQVDFEKFPRVH